MIVEEVGRAWLSSMVIYTIGHSNRPIELFLSILQAFEIEHLVDVRTIPKSRHNPQFWADALAESLHEAGIAYTQIPELGGRRSAKKDSPNTGWRNRSFQGYADHMQTEEFSRGIEKLIEIAQAQQVAIMCAEAVPWRCHRSLVGDALLVRGIEVKDIMSETSAKAHKLTSFARVDGLQITYPPEVNAE